MWIFHHTGILVANIEEAILSYSGIFGELSTSQIYLIESQKVKVCFIKMQSDVYIELVQPLNENSAVYNLLKKNISYYHVGYKVTDIDNEVRKLIKLNYKPLEFFDSEAFEGNRCIFLFTPDAHLIELIQENSIVSS
jgi:methylmalonyl-CoA/ethylmalonyl-CoA epimerase